MFISGRKHKNLFLGNFDHADSKFRGVYVIKTWYPTERKIPLQATKMVISQQPQRLSCSLNFFLNSHVKGEGVTIEYLCPNFGKRAYRQYSVSLDQKGYSGS